MKLSKSTKTAILFSALIFACVLVGPRTAHGNLHPADPLILLSGMLLPLPHALWSVGIASLLADMGKGFYALAPITLVIKLLMVWAVRLLLRTQPAKKHPELMAAPAALIPIPGYYLAELIYQFCVGQKMAAFSLAAVTLRKNSVQAAASILLFIIIYDLYKGIKAGKEEVRRLKNQKEEDPE